MLVRLRNASIKFNFLSQRSIHYQYWQCYKYNNQQKLFQRPKKYAFASLINNNTNTNTNADLYSSNLDKYKNTNTASLIQEMASNFKVVRAIKTDYGIEVTKFKSDKTGLSVFHVDIEAPIVNGFFTLSTETVDDYGLPHTLEHLVFLGSELYPYKGVLDSLANRAIAQGTNAWTADDNTCYRITTAGSEGFLKMLPIYVDHILYPTITESGYITEVHNINGNGEDAGVVYCEMQGRQNNGENRLVDRMRRLLYPEGCGYHYEAGGLMECLRKLDAETIRQYHRDYYRPDNLCLVITGKLSHEDLLKTLGPIEERIISKGPLPPYKRPWVEFDLKLSLEKTVEEVVEFPDEDESIGEILIGWHGPKVNEFLDLMALEMLHKYLSDSPVSDLQKEFVEIEKPLCTDVYFHINQNLRTAIYAEFTNVPTKELETLSKQIFLVLERVANEGIDMQRMQTVIHRDKLKSLKYVETNPHNGFAAVCIKDFLYGKENAEELEPAFKDLQYYDEVSKFTNEKWVSYLRKYYLDPPHVTLLGRPSDAFAKKLLEDEKKRIEQQCQDLGPEKLKELDQRLQEAKNENDIPVPPEILANFQIPKVSSIPFIEVVTGWNRSDSKASNPVQDWIDKDSKFEFPYFIQFDHVKSSFITAALYMSTSAFPHELRPYIDLYQGSFFSLPLNRPDGTKLTYEDVVKALNEDTVQYSFSLGMGEAFEDLLILSIKVEASKYQKAIQWLRDLLWHTEFSVERLKIAAAKFINDIPSIKRDGHRMSSDVMQTIIFDPKMSNQYATNTLKQERFLPEAQKLLDEHPEKVVEDLKKLREILTRPENFRLHVVGDILKLQNPKSYWVEHFYKPKEEVKKLAPIRLSREVLTKFGESPGDKGYIVNLSAIESTFSVHCAKSITTFDSPDFAPLLVLCEYLHTMEGPLWKAVRGEGLAYSNWLKVSVEMGLIFFNLYRSPDTFKAFEKSRETIQDYVDKKVEFDTISLDSAKSSVVFALVSAERNIAQAAAESFILQTLKNLPANYNRIMIERVQAVTLDDIYKMLNKYVINLFRAETSNLVVVSTPGKTKDVREGFEQIGFKLDEKTLDEIL